MGKQGQCEADYM